VYFKARFYFKLDIYVFLFFFIWQLQNCLHLYLSCTCMYLNHVQILFFYLYLCQLLVWKENKNCLDRMVVGFWIFVLDPIWFFYWFPMKFPVFSKQIWHIALIVSKIKGVKGTNSPSFYVNSQGSTMRPKHSHLQIIYVKCE
jgi:hypothetical protein